MKESFLKKFASIPEDKRDALIYRAPATQRTITWNDAYTEIIPDHMSPLALEILRALTNAKII